MVLNLRGKAETINKLGIKKNSRLLLLGGGSWLSKAISARFGRQVNVISTKLSEPPRAGSYDMLVICAKSKSQLREAFRLSRQLMDENGCIWAVVRKKIKKEIQPFTEGEVFSAGKEIGLVDVKVASLSEYEYALKFVIPLKYRTSPAK